MCGKKDNLIPTKVAGSSMQLCASCSKLGKKEEINSDSPTKKTFYKKKKQLNKEYVTQDYENLIKSELNNKDLTPHQLARATNIKESQINKFITGKLQPDIETAKKIEKFLGISLITDEDPNEGIGSYMVDDEDDAEATSLGDLIKKKLEKNGN